MTVEDFPDFCHAHGMKCTPQRQEVFAILNGSVRHPSVDEIWAVVKTKIPSVTRESVYRILNEFSALGLISRLDALSAARYDTRIAPHAHFICEVCGTVMDYPLPDGMSVPEGMPSERHHLELRVTGICDNCRKNDE